MISVMIIGANGRMGQTAKEAFANTSQFQLIGALGRNDDVQTELKRLKPDVAIDLTLPDAVETHLNWIIDVGVRPVIGTSGLAEDAILRAQIRCEAMQLGGMIVPNFSMGAALMMQFAKEAAKYFDAVEIIEAHHEKKLDAPSGTAIKTASMINDGRAIRPLIGMTDPSRGKNVDNIPIHAIRMPGVLAEQTVLFGELGETLSITHRSINRDCFKAGIRNACLKVMTLNHLQYGLVI
jgi:4-hydroxy-tetrahydrodipicolinate reductase